jgi:predicted transcriptional regulator
VRIEGEVEMTKEQLVALIERVDTWPQEAKDELADLIEEIEERHVGVYRLSEEERAGVERGLAEMRQGRFASDDEIAAIFKIARSGE